ncbi:hypothetical protein EMIHUDRAFT_243732 [Emiliania huxleyi CCMP1516]|uniref:EamA domain-containing protein n=2 Tax=Emiliania huxleyi TaxID=2903 RepID=A0A0D3J4Y5_EMIH1|nr:hypothetical protein EMIHUDRAFT_243732 [Emiliania huxleyi CCMP1516]EOD18570.1 hypothetical protein EMIHUDRAFT_243732 [Emiliania huxleyi CCMP1516]|eukprot:XP_005770999.1 hypothetical protein EMIHUDRAFT_243732 [Emiliania huxleyi CCMP1516]
MAEPSTSALLTGSRHVEGVALITSAALLFGILAAVVKSVALPTLLKMQIRSLLEWLICLAAAAFCRETRRRGGDTGAAMRVYDNSGAEARPSTFAKCGGGEGGEREAWAKLLFGPRELSGWLVLRAFLYWVFLCCWWLALEAMPLGDATTVVYIAPVFTALHARLLRAAVVAGLLPVCTNKSGGAPWTAVNHVSCVFSAFVFTPLALVGWVDARGAAGQLADGVAALRSPLQWALLAAISAVSSAGLALQTLGYQRLVRELEAFSRVREPQPMLQLALKSALLFHEPLEPLGLGGVGLIACATVLNLTARVRHSRADAERAQRENLVCV